MFGAAPSASEYMAPAVQPPPVELIHTYRMVRAWSPRSLLSFERAYSVNSMSRRHISTLPDRSLNWFDYHRVRGMRQMDLT